MGMSLISLSLTFLPASKHPKHHHPFFFIPKATLKMNKKPPSFQKVQEVHSIKEFDSTLIQARDNLVLVEYISNRRSQTPPLTFQLSGSHENDDVRYLLVKADKSEETKELCLRESVKEVPHYNFYKNNEKVHDKSNLKAEEFIRYVQYYGNSHGSVIQIRSVDEIERLMDDRTAGGCDGLVVLNLGLRNCEPCVKIYPTVIRLSSQLADDVVFMRLIGDDNGRRNLEFLRKNSVVRVPAFLFIRNGEILGSYVGSEKAILVREVFRYHEKYRNLM